MDNKYKVYIINTESITSNRYITLAIKRAFEKSPYVSAVTLGDFSNALGEFVHGEFDIFMCIGGAADSAPILARLCKLASISVLWITEDPYELRRNVAYSDIFDVVFTNDKMSVPEYLGKASHLPLAADKVFNFIPALNRDEDYIYDLLFIGTAWPNRVSLINDLLGAFGPTLKAKLALSYNQFLPVPKLIYPELITDWRCSNIEFARLANKSRVVLSIDRIFSASPGSPLTGSTPPPRLFEAAAAGGFQVYVSESNEAKSYFDHGQEFIHCGYDSAVEAVRTALQDPIKRIEGAAAAQRRAMQDHLYENRVEEIVRTLRQTQPRNKAVRKRVSSLKTVLVVTHNVAGSRPGGGVEIYQEQLKNLPVNYRVIYLHPVDSRTFRVTCYSETKDYEIPQASGQYDLTNRSLENLFEKILFEWRVDIAHFQHLLGFSLSLPLIARSCGVPTVWTYHDHYLICERFTLLDYEGRFCDTASKDLVTCDVCLSASNGLPAGSQARRRNFVEKVAGGLDAIITSTAFSKDYIRRIYPTIRDESVSVIEMLTPNTSSFTKAGNNPRSLSGPLKVAISGNFSDVKGAGYMLRIFNMMRDDNIEFTVLGRVDKPFDDVLEALEFKNVKVLGGYDQAKIADILSIFQMSLHLSLWPETYMISLSESWLAGLVPIVTNLGAQGERVTDQLDGFIVQPHDPASVVNRLREVISGALDLSSMRNRIQSKKFSTAEEHVNDLELIYRKLIEKKPLVHVDNLLRYRTYYSLDAFDCGIRTNSRTWNTPETVWDETFSSVLEPNLEPPTFDFPSEFAHLSLVKAGAGNGEVKIEFEEMRCDGRNATRKNALASSSLGLKGWITVSTDIQFVKRFIVLKGATVSLYVPASVVSRADVAEAFKNLDSAEAGFDLNIDVSYLPSGDYEICILNVFNGKVYDTNTCHSVFIEHPNHTDGTLVWVPGEGLFDDVPLGTLPFTDVTLGFEEQAGDIPLTVAPVFENRFRVVGSVRVSDLHSYFLYARIVLTSRADLSIYWTKVVSVGVRARAGSARDSSVYEFEVDLALNPLPSDLYDVSLAVYSREGALRSPLIASLDTRIGVQHKLVLRSQFDEYIDAAKFIVEPGTQLVIDTVAALGSGQGQSGTIDVSGWAYLKGVGAPRATFSYFEHDGLRVFTSGTVVNRDDVADHLSDTSAAQSGFRFVMPSEMIQYKGLNLCQVYDDGVVVFQGFGALIDAYRHKMQAMTELEIS